MHFSLERRSPAYTALTARPLRKGVLVPDIPGLPWHSVFAVAIASQVRTWGGSGNLVFPLRADTADSDLFWALVELFDPDWWGVYCGTYRELEDIDETAYTAWRSQMKTELRDVPWEQLSGARAEAENRPLVRPGPRQLETGIPTELGRLLRERGYGFPFESSVPVTAALAVTVRTSTSSTSTRFPLTSSTPSRGRI